MAMIAGTENPDTLDGTSGDDVIVGLGGNDILNGLGGNDLLVGGPGDDQHNGGTGDDLYHVESAGDVVNEADGEGFDIVYTYASFALLDSSWIERLSSINHQHTTTLTLTGNIRDNDVWGGQGIDTLNGGGGNDSLLGFGANDFLNGGSGNDRMWGMDGDDQLDGGEGNDELSGGAGANTLAGGLGDDIYFVESDRDSITEADGEGFDTVYVFDGFTLPDSVRVERLSSADHLLDTALTLTGNIHDNQIWGGIGLDTLSGGGGTDILVAFDGEDSLDGGLGADLMIGGGGADYFNFTTALGATNSDTISDFLPGTDKIFLSTEIFQGLPPDDLENRFFSGTFIDTLTTPAIYHNRTTGQIFYDSNGNAAGGSTEFARVTPGLVLTKSDFVLTPNSAPIANADDYAVMKGGAGFLTPFKDNDVDVDGQQLWVNSVGTDTDAMVIVTRGLSNTSVTGIYGTLSGGAKSDQWGYTLDNADPDTIAIAPGTTVTETFYYEITDGNSGSPNFTLYPNAAFTIGTITIQITAAPSGIARAAILGPPAPDPVDPPAAPDPAGGPVGIDPGAVFASEDAGAPAMAWLGHFPQAMPHGWDAPAVALV
jgi:VCBS repeat-containing protein